jgi:outer membrane protein assembly factor BamB
MAVERTGDVRWTVEDIGWIVTSPAIGSDGTVYAASRDSTLYAVDAGSRKRWAFRAQGSFLLSSPALARDGTILVGSNDGRLYAINPDGSERWTFQSGDTIRTSPAIALDGTIYFGSRDHLYALTPDGALKWTVPVGREGVPCCRSLHSPAIGSDGTVYVGGDGGLHAVDPNGQLRWTYRGLTPSSGTDAFRSPVVAGDGTIYVGGRRLYALAPDGTLRWDHPIGIYGVNASPPAIGLDGTLVATSNDSTLYAIVELAGSNGGFAGAPWPKARGDRANTGRARAP